MINLIFISFNDKSSLQMKKFQLNSSKFSKWSLQRNFKNFKLLDVEDVIEDSNLKQKCQKVFQIAYKRMNESQIKMKAHNFSDWF
jgi:hypothetical protein